MQEDQKNQWEELVTGRVGVYGSRLVTRRWFSMVRRGLDFFQPIGFGAEKKPFSISSSKLIVVLV
jgi:hypothetical protein